MSRKTDQKSITASEILSLSKKEALIMELLAGSARGLYGLELIEESGGALKRGTIYVTLQRMQEKDLIYSWQEQRTAPDVGIPRRLYRVSGYGERVLAAYQAALTTFYSQPLEA
jgi:PadR family transcriptional regulator PadR